MAGLADKHIVVAGSSGLIGTHLVTHLEACGARVSCWDMHCTPEEYLTEGSVLQHKTDASSQSSVEASYAASVAAFGDVHSLINLVSDRGPGRSFFAALDEVDIGDWGEVVGKNLTSALLLSRTVAPGMSDLGGGSIVHASSIYGPLGVDHRVYEGVEERMNAPASYAVAKSGILGLTRYLATLWGQEGIRVNSVAPGGVLNGQDERFIAQYSARVPLRRMAQASEISPAILFLASDVSSYITGQCLFVDGGWSSW